MRTRLNDWLQVRHSVAHGFALPNHAFLLNQHGGYTLRLCHLKDCREFMRRVATSTDAALAQHLATTFGIAKPW
jgi:hypothetical protein